MLETMLTIVEHLPEGISLLASAIGIGTFTSQLIKNKQAVAEVNFFEKKGQYF